MIQELQSGLAGERDAREKISRLGTQVHISGTVVRVSVAIQAERRRILNALMAPEYMDLWLTMPGVERPECRLEQRSSQAFRIDFFAPGATSGTFYGSCVRTRTDEVTYLWENMRDRSNVKSVVKMRLRCGPRKCSLHLQHMGLQDQQECEWYSRMWQTSLARLRGFMERTHSRQ